MLVRGRRLVPRDEGKQMLWNEVIIVKVSWHVAVNLMARLVNEQNNIADGFHQDCMDAHIITFVFQNKRAAIMAPTAMKNNAGL